MLLGVNFELGLFHLVPFDDWTYEDRSFWVPYKFCDKQYKKPKMRVIRSNIGLKTKE
jgi:hypothetical protein